MHLGKKFLAVIFSPMVYEAPGGSFDFKGSRGGLIKEGCLIIKSNDVDMKGGTFVLVL